MGRSLLLVLLAAVFGFFLMIPQPARGQAAQSPYPCTADCRTEALAPDPTKGCGNGFYWVPYPPTNPMGTCRPCQKGFYCPGTPYGAFLDSKVNLNRPIHCPRGMYNPMEGAGYLGQCINCPGGSYSDWKGQSECKSCPAGTYVSDTGSTHVNDCIPCTTGHYCPTRTTTPVPCPVGRYIRYRGMSSEANCVDCPYGYTCKLGQIDPVPCPVGTYSDVKNTFPGNCQSCPTGHYCPLGSPVPTACALGTYRNIPNAGAKEDCVECPIGQECQTQSKLTWCGPYYGYPAEVRQCSNKGTLDATSGKWDATYRGKTLHDDTGDAAALAIAGMYYGTTSAEKCLEKCQTMPLCRVWSYAPFNNPSGGQCALWTMKEALAAGRHEASSWVTVASGTYSGHCDAGSDCIATPANGARWHDFVQREVNGMAMVGASFPVDCPVDSAVRHYDDHFRESGIELGPWIPGKGCLEGCPYPNLGQSYCHEAGDGRLLDRRPSVRRTFFDLIADTNTTTTKWAALNDTLTDFMNDEAFASIQEALDARDKNGRTPLDVAAMIGDVESMEILLRAEDQSRNDTTDADYAMLKSDAEDRTVPPKYLERRDIGGYNALMQAIRFAHVPAVELLTKFYAGKLQPWDRQLLLNSGVRIEVLDSVPVYEEVVHECSTYITGPNCLGAGHCIWGSDHTCQEDHSVADHEHHRRRRRTR